MQVDKLLISGYEQPKLDVDTSGGDAPSQTFIIERSTRGLAEAHEVTLSKDKLVELRFEDDTVWLCNGDTIGEAFPEALPSLRGQGQALLLPTQVQSSGPERGLLDTVALKVVRIFTKKVAEDVVSDLVRDRAQKLEDEQLSDKQLPDTPSTTEQKKLKIGLYSLDEKFRLSDQQFTPPPANQRPADSRQTYLLFLHGTASSTKGSFDGIHGTELWTYIRKTYADNVLAFQHRTLTESPLRNVLTLIQQLPDNCILHLVSHSRGGLVGELLGRFCNDDAANVGFDHQEKEYLRKADRADDLGLIEQISQLVATKGIVVRKFVRVACPAGGTILASKRLELFFNVSLNLLGVATGLEANPVYHAFKELIRVLLRAKNDVQVLPGLEAMNPESPFIKVLNLPASTVQLNSPLAVISGNCTLKPNLKALLVLLSKVFYLTDNDLVVNTMSMYRGSRRTRRVQYYFDATPDTDHFHYFRNLRTVQALALALQATDDNTLPGFAALPDGTRQERGVALGLLEGGRLSLPLPGQKISGTKPIVLLLPGIMGSTLSTGDKPLWIDYWRFAAGDLADLAIDNPGIQATGLVGTSYQQLATYLQPTYDVVTHAYDWRLDLRDSIKALNDRIIELLRFKQPIKLVAHSMGGVLVRDFILAKDTVWNQLSQSEGFQLVMLGTPLRGSFRIPAVLMGLDSIIQKLSLIDIRHSKKDLVSIFTRFPGILNLLPLSRVPEEDFSQLATWEALREALGRPDWPLPTAELLREFGEYQEGVLAGMDEIDLGKAVYVAGQDKATPSGYRLNRNNRGLEFIYTAEGDQSVTWATGIPKQLLDRNAVYYVPVSHGELAAAPRIFAGLGEILAKGATNDLSRVRPLPRALPATVQPVRADDFDLTPLGVERTLLGLSDTDWVPPTVPAPLRVRVSHGDLRYASFPLLAGHFSDDGIQYAEKAIDRYLNGALVQRRSLGSYPGPVNSSELFLVPNADYAGAIVVGLGELGQLTAFRLISSIEHGVSRYLHGLATGSLPGKLPTVVGVSALLIGSEYGGLTVKTSVHAILQGIQNANGKLQKLLGAQCPQVSVVEFVELYDDASFRCLSTVRQLELEASTTLPVVVDKLHIKAMFGAKKRLPNDSSSDWWNQLSVLLHQPEEGNPTVRHLRFTLSTSGAREEQQDLYTSRTIIEQFLRQISAERNWRPEVAKTVFELLIPNDMKESLQRQGNLSWVLDRYTAAYPWELLQDAVSDAKPLCVNAGMIRRLATPEYRTRIVRAALDNALIVGDPQLGIGSAFPQLPGAAQEARAVENLLKPTLAVTTKLNETATAREIILALFSQEYKVIHLAGHGVYLPDDPNGSGMVIGPGMYLSTREIAQMSAVPELVFVNCCYLGQIDGEDERRYQDRYKLAANIGTQLIYNGVKAVVVAGWAVDDEAALMFAQTFYSQMLNGNTFGDAVKAARRLVYEQFAHRTNTWGAYQCYGDPFYRLRNVAPSNGARERNYLMPTEAEIELENLLNELHTGSYDARQVLNELEAISRGVAKSASLCTPHITELEASIYQELYLLDKALAKIEQLMQGEKATFSVQALERYCNIRAKLCMQRLLSETSKPAPDQQVLDEIIADLESVIEDLVSLNRRVGRTTERLGLLGSAYKRLAQATSGANRLPALQASAYYYREANDLCQKASKGKPSDYALPNWYTMEAISRQYGQKWGASRDVTDATRVLAAQQQSYTLPTLAQAQKGVLDLITNNQYADTADMDYWTMVTVANAKLALLLLAKTPTADAEKELTLLYHQLWRKAGSLSKKKAEIEHLNFLRELLNPANTTTDTPSPVYQFIEGLYQALLPEAQ